MPALWAYIERLVGEGRIIASKEVYAELEAHASEDLLAWLRAHKDIFVLDAAQIEKAQEVINEVYVQYKEGYRPEISDGADPFVVATAMVHDTAVITQEVGLGVHDPSQVKTPKIPTVCEYYGIECVNILGFIDREGLTITVS